MCISDSAIKVAGMPRAGRARYPLSPREREQEDARGFPMFSRAIRRGGFSLIEMTAVLALMAVLAGIVTINVRHHLIVGKQNAARAEVATICDALEAFYSANGRYPTTEEGLAVLSEKTDKSPEPLLKQMPLDPWGHRYQYNTPGRNGEPYEVICFGADGREGGSGADADIYSWDLKNSAGKGTTNAAAR